MFPQQVDNLRWCQRIKDTQVYWHVEGLGKKIRKYKPFGHKPVNANTQQRQIQMFYKVGWEYEHAHYNITADISDVLYVQPNYDCGDEKNMLRKYYDKIAELIFRFKAEHQDESACKVTVKQYLNLEQMAKNKYYNLICAKGVYKNCLNAFESLSRNLYTNMIELQKKGINEYDGGQYWHTKDLFEFMISWIEQANSEIKKNPDPEKYPDKAPLATQILQFVSNFTETVSTMLSQKTPSFFNVQPNIKMLTYIVHPALLGIYSVYQKQKILWENQYEHDINKVKFDERIQNNNKLPDDIQHFQIPKVVFINLDGYESEYNIELARNMDKHLMYVSFPRFQNHAEEEDLSVNNRFFKKIFFNYTRELYQYDMEESDVIYIQEDMDDEGHNIKEQFQVKFNPQQYYKCVDGIFKKKDKKNHNLYMLPISFQYLQKQMENLFKNSQDAQKFSSYFVWFLLRDFVGDDIKKFNPSYIVFSYSGRINIIDEHFVRIMQELCIASSRKVLFFPNFISEISEELALNYTFDNFPSSMNNIYKISEGFSEDIFHKICQFIKISSGTYNLEVPYERPTILSRYKTAKVNNYILSLLNALSLNEYQHLSGRVSDIIMRSPDIILSRSISECSKDVRDSVPQFYLQIFSTIHALLTNQSLTKNFSPTIEQLVDKIRQNMIDISQSEEKTNIEYLIKQIIQNFCLQISAEKVSDAAYLYLKTRANKDEWMDIKQNKDHEKDYKDTIKQMLNGEQDERAKVQYNNNPNGFYCLSLKYRNSNKQKTTMQIYPSTELLYKVDHRHKMEGPGNKFANIMLMNHIEKENMYFTSYAGLIDLNKSQDHSNKINTQSVIMHPVVFNDGAAIGKYAVRTNWNYTETRNYYMLYWPLQYNLLEAKLHAIEQKHYEPRIIPEIYLARILPQKQHSKLEFNRINADLTQLLPRRFTSSYELIDQDKVFIFGGFYERENNYLNLQTDITGVDLSHYDDENRKCAISNQKGTMYQMINEKSFNKKTNNSYVRARREFQFLELTQLTNQLTEEELFEENENRTVFMVGGYGQDFVRPFSLMSCLYYEIVINVPSRSIRSIKQRTIYNKVITANLKGFIKNKGSFRKFSLLENGILKNNAFLDSDHHIAHRTIFKVNRAKKAVLEQEQYEQNCTKDLQANKFELFNKTKYFFAIKIFGQFKKQYSKLAYKIGEAIGQKMNEAEEFILTLSNQGNHYLTIQKDNNVKFMIQIMLEVEVEQMDVNEGKKIQRVPLPHGSIISIDIKNKVIYAIIYHHLYTKGSYVLTNYVLKSEQSEIVLQIIHRFPANMSQFSLFIPKIGQILLLHGITYENAKIRDIFLKHRREDNTIREYQLKIVNHLPQIAEKSTSFTCFLKDSNKQNRNLEIESLTFILPRKKDNKQIQCIANRLKLSLEIKQSFYWEHQWDAYFYFEESASKKIIPISYIQEIREINQDHHHLTLNQSSDESNTLSSFCTYMMKVVGSSKKNYVGYLILQKGDQENKGKIVVSGEDSIEGSQIMKNWKIAIPIQMHTKSLGRYQDMDIQVPYL